MAEVPFFGVLSVIVLSPIAAALIILLLPEERKDAARIVAAVTMGICLILALTVYFGYNAEVSDPQSELYALANGQYKGVSALDMPSTFRYVEDVPWIESLGIHYKLGVDGISAPMVLLTALVGFTGVLISWRIEDRTREFMAFFMLLVSGVVGVFVSMDLFVLFFFYEFAIFPMYVLIVVWGWKVTRVYASMKLTLYLLIGSMVALVGVLAMYVAAGEFFTANPDLLAPGMPAYSFDFEHIQRASMLGAFGASNYLGLDGVSLAKFWFPFVFLGFGVLAGVFPFHNWSPDGHVAAPTAVSMIHAGVLMKLGAFAALRTGVQLMPEGARVHLPWIILLTMVNVVYGAFIAFRQRDFKYVIGFSSVSHMGLVSMGFATMNVIGMTGAGLQMFSHGAMTALFFACVGMVYDRAHTRDIPSLGGMSKKMPLVAVAFIIGGLVSMGMPGFSGFVAEIPIYMGLWNGPGSGAGLHLGGSMIVNYYPWIAILSVISIVVTAAYIMRVVQLVFFGEFNAKKFPEVGDVTIIDKSALALLVGALLILGIQPAIMAPMIQSSVAPIVAALGGGM
ncbi:MAG: NADH-quinone oxidoreductase subunit M [Anaerolineae bacterium]|nr:NADH-quinone oxidoreductase subunit M [Anaerolineae bacterium]